MTIDDIKIFKYWYRNQTNFVSWANTLSEASERLESGVMQGGLTSPKLFNLYVNELIVELSRMRVGCSLDGDCINNISYADDIMSPTAGGLGELLKVCEAYAVTLGLL